MKHSDFHLTAVDILVLDDLPDVALWCSAIGMWLDLAYSLNQGRDSTLNRRAARLVEMLESTRNDSVQRAAKRSSNELADVIPEGEPHPAL